MEAMDEKNLDIYGSAPIPWSHALDELEKVSAPNASNPPKTYWLATVGRDGRPHVAGVGALWVDGKFYFVSGEGTRKSRNVAENPSCTIAVSLPTLDLVVEGTASRVVDQATLQRLVELYVAQGWPASVSGDVITAPYSAPSAGPSPWNLYVVTPIVAYGVGGSEETPGAMRWSFGS